MNGPQNSRFASFSQDRQNPGQVQKKSVARFRTGPKYIAAVHGCPIECVEGGAPSRNVRAQAVLLAGFRGPKEVHLPPKFSSQPLEF